MKMYKKSDLKLVTLIERAENPILLGYDIVMVEDNGLLCTSILDPEKTYVYYDVKPGSKRPTGVTFAEHRDWDFDIVDIYLKEGLFSLIEGLFSNKSKSEYISEKDLLRWVKEAHESEKFYFINYQPTEKKGEKTKKYGDKWTFTS